MREDRRGRIVRNSKKGHKPSLIEEFELVDAAVLAAIGAAAFVIFSAGSGLKDKQMTEPATRMEQSTDSLVEDNNYQSAYDQVMRSLGDEKIQEEKRKADEAERIQAQKEISQLNAYNESKNQQQADDFLKYQEEKSGRGL